LRVLCALLLCCLQKSPRFFKLTLHHLVPSTRLFLESKIKSLGPLNCSRLFLVSRGVIFAGRRVEL
jgi:hypothetical protein